MRPGDELFATIERHGIIGPEGMIKLATLPAKELGELYDETFQAIYDAQLGRVWDADSSNPPDPFTLHASASIRGDSGCSAINCRGDKISFLARYAALYGVSENQLPKKLTVWNELSAEYFEIAAGLRASLFCGVERLSH